jgi:hypothetical protein
MYFFLAFLQFLLVTITPCSGVLLEKPPVAQLFRNFPTFYGTTRFITVFTRALHWSLSWARSIPPIPSHRISPRSMLIFESKTRSTTHNRREYRTRNAAQHTTGENTEQDTQQNTQQERIQNKKRSTTHNRREHRPINPEQDTQHNTLHKRTQNKTRSTTHDRREHNPPTQTHMRIERTYIY